MTELESIVRQPTRPAPRMRSRCGALFSPRLAAGITLACALASPTSSAEPPEPYEKLADKAVLKVRAFEPTDVRLLEGPFKKAFDDNTGFLLRIEPDRLLHRFLAYNGLAPKGELYGGWEAEGLSGHGLGHYLSACALAYASSGDARLLDRVTYIVDAPRVSPQSHGDPRVRAGHRRVDDQHERVGAVWRRANVMTTSRIG